MRTPLLISTLVAVALASFAICLNLGYIKIAWSTTDNEMVPMPPMAKAIGEYEEYINESLCQSGTPGAAVAIVKDTSIVYMQGFGVRDKNAKEIIDIHTVFRLASVSKCFTSMLTATIVEDSLLSWNDQVVKYWPDFVGKPNDQKNKLTIKHLLSHTTGFPYHAYTNLIEEGHSLPTLIGKLQKLNLANPVGQQYSYQNVAFSIIDKVVESSMGKSFEENMQERLFNPLHMEDVSMTYEDLLQNPNTALPHHRNRDKEEWERIPLSSTYYNVLPAGGINASISDMGKWLKAMLGNAEKVISPPTITQLFQPVVKADPKNKNFNRWKKIEKSYYGLGWRILCFENDTIAYHGGYVKGYRSEVVIRPKSKMGICVLTNGAGYFPNNAIPTFLRIYDKHHDKTSPG